MEIGWEGKLINGFFCLLGWLWTLGICIFIGGIAMYLTCKMLGVPMTNKKKKLRRLKIKPGQYDTEEKIACIVGIIVTLGAITLVVIYDNIIIPSVAAGAFVLACYTMYSK